VLLRRALTDAETTRSRHRSGQCADERGSLYTTRSRRGLGQVLTSQIRPLDWPGTYRPQDLVYPRGMACQPALAHTRHQARPV